MDNTNNNNDIDALLGILWLDEQDKYHAALTALIAERNEYKARCKAQHEVMADMVGKEREADRDRDLRERLVCAALQGAARDAHMHHEASSMGTRAVYIVDAAIAAMRKGETDAK